MDLFGAELQEFHQFLRYEFRNLQAAQSYVGLGSTGVAHLTHDPLN